LVFGFFASLWIGLRFLHHLLAITAATVQTADTNPIPRQEGHILQEKQLGNIEKVPRKRKVFISRHRYSFFSRRVKQEQKNASAPRSVSGASGCYAGGREFDSGRTNTQGLKITE